MNTHHIKNPLLQMNKEDEIKFRSSNMQPQRVAPVSSLVEERASKGTQEINPSTANQTQNQSPNHNKEEAKSPVK